MKQITLSENDSPLLNFAVSRLDPEVFSHPVWVRFGRKENPASLKVAEDLFSAAKHLQDEDIRGACQLWLICAIYQNNVGQSSKALRITREVLSLAERRGLCHEMVWAIWGTCAIYIQQGNYTEAISHLTDLQAVLSQRNEWVLAGFVDVIKQSLVQSPSINAVKHCGIEPERESGDVLAHAFDWLLHWGFSHRAVEEQCEMTPEASMPYVSNQSTLTQSFFSAQRWQGHWHTLMLMFKGEVKLQWAKNDSRLERKHFSFWGSIISSLRLYLSPQNSETKADTPQFLEIPILPPVKEDLPPSIKTRQKKPNSRIEKAAANPYPEQTTFDTSLTVHMLGMFSMTIGDLAVKLPASRGLSLLKYLLLHNGQHTPREVLMDVFWPEAEPETARNNLNVAMHKLRKALFAVTDLPMIIFEAGAYSLAPELPVWLDVEEFERCVKAGQRLEARNQLTDALAEYEAAISLYQGEFLEQNPYEEWTVSDRERLRLVYLDTLDRLSQIYFDQERYAACVTVCQLILRCDRCREDTYCLLMRCYSRQGQHHLALRQYQSCVEALQAELDVEPAPETTQLCEQIRRREYV